ncbi:MAG: hypothetical protein QNL04_08290 [SAR324 cluster bacterium]|nr:hypothetical protein [SAR324 cluster bacterium]
MPHDHMQPSRAEWAALCFKNAIGTVQEQLPPFFLRPENVSLHDLAKQATPEMRDWVKDLKKIIRFS